MRNRFLGSVAALAAGAGLAWGQSPAMYPQGYDPAYAPNASGVMPANYPQAAPIIPPQMPGMGMGPSEAGLMGGGGPEGAMYPPQGNFGDMFNGGKGVPSYSKSFMGWPIVWGGFDYLLWVPKTMNINYPVATTGAAATSGILGNASTGVLFPGQPSFEYGSGFKVYAGAFLHDDRRTGIEASAWRVGTLSRREEARSDGAGFPLIARPFVDSTTNAQTSLLIAAPNVASGNLGYRFDTKSFSADINYLVNLFRSCPEDGCGFGMNVNALIGLRYANIEEHFEIGSSSTSLSVPGASPTFFLGVPTLDTSITTVNDSFRTSNSFYGGQVGTQIEVRNGRAFYKIDAKLALGAMNQVADIKGYSTVRRGTGPDASTSLAVGGLYANTDTIGRYRNDEFAIIPDVGLTLGYHLHRCMSVQVGYNFVYFNNVARPTELLNPLVNPAVIPTSAAFGTALPVVPIGDRIKQTDYYLHGLNFGVTFKY
jgi:hypothetical protein